ncbi:MAG: TonB-dependent receptor [Bacteroidota bacterium]|nr:TonB-dependent receptor [Bacteroidota bacterium]
MPALRYGLLLLFLFVLPEAFAQQAILRGFVTDEISEQPLQGATVVLRDGDRLVTGAATDGDGYFVLNRVTPGDYALVISFVGYESYTESLTLSSGEVREFRVALSVRAAEIDELVVEAEAEGGITTVVAGLETVVPAAIQRVPVPGVSGDLASYLQTVPGVTVQGDRGGQFFVRGGAVDQNLALLDGLPVYMPFHVLSFYSAFPEELVDRAAFYTGGFGARYGGRTSSILDVTARNGNKQNVAGSVSLAPFLSSATIEGPIVDGRVSAILSVRQSFVEDLMPDLFGQRMPYRFGDRFGKIHALLGGSHEMSFTFLDTDDRGDIAGSKKSVFGEAEASIKNDSTEVAWNNRVYGGTWIYRSNRLPIVSRLTAGRSEMGNTFGPDGNPERSATVESSEASLRLEWLLKAGEIAAGTSFRRTDLGYVLDDLFTEYTSSQVQLDEIQAYLETGLTLMDDRVYVNPGLHFYSLPDRSRSWTDPRIRVAVWPMGQDGRYQVNAAWGIYHQAVSGLTDERDLGNLFTAWIITPDDQEVQQSMHGILGGNVQIQPWLSVALEGFYKDYEHITAPIFSPFPKFTTTLQEASGAAYGADVRLNMENRPFWYESVLDGTFSYTWSTVEYEAGPYTYHPAHDRRHQFNALLHAQKGDVGMTLQWQYGSGLPFTESGGFDVWYLLTPDVDVATEAGVDRIVYAAPFGGRQPTYSRFDIWIERRVERGRTIATLRAGALNILNRKNLFYYDLFTFSRVDQLPLIPSVGFKLEFR